MLFSIERTLEAVAQRPSFPTLLVPGDSLDRMRSLAAQLPSFAYATGFEARLGPGPSPADLSTWVTAASGGRRALAAMSPADARCAALLETSEWRCIADFARRWAEPGSPARLNVPFVIFEFDVETLACPPVPSVFLSLQPLPGWRLRGAGAEDFPFSWVLDEVLPRLRGSDLSAAVRGRVEEAYAQLPTGASFLHVAAMLGRRVDAVRLFLSLPHDALDHYLERVGWPGPIPQLAILRKRHADGRPTVEIQLDVGEELLPRASLELSLESRTPGRPSVEAAAVLSELVAHGLCDRRKAEALLAWPGIFRTPLEQGGWPCTFVQDLSHVKIACSSQGLEAKAYFFYTPHFRLFSSDAP